MKKFLILIIMSIFVSSTAYAIPSLQLWVDGMYDPVDETWITYQSSFNLYLISTEEITDDIFISLALAPRSDYNKDDYPDDAYVSFDGDILPEDAWIWGNAPINDAEGGSGDMGPHDVFPTWYAEANTGAASLSGIYQALGDVLPGTDYWSPLYGGPISNSWGYVQTFSIDVNPGIMGLHIDAYTKNPDGTLNEFAPFSHDAGYAVPEPGTIILLSIGLIGTGIAARRRRK